MYDKVPLSTRIIFRLTPDDHRQLAEWARAEHRSVANLVYTLVCQALDRQRSSQPQHSNSKEAVKQ